MNSDSHLVPHGTIPTQPTPHLSARLCRLGSQLLHAQCWAWGRDIHSPGGNLLLRYGADRLRPPAGVAGCSQYTFTADQHTFIRLWGFGVYVGGSTGMYLGRFHFIPRRSVLAEAWAPRQVEQGPRFLPLDLLHLFTGWASGYETWVEATMGRDYRQQVLRSWTSPSAPDPFCLSTQWHLFQSALATSDPVRKDAID